MQITHMSQSSAFQFLILATDFTLSIFIWCSLLVSSLVLTICINPLSSFLLHLLFFMRYAIRRRPGGYLLFILLLLSFQTALFMSWCDPLQFDDVYGVMNHEQFAGFFWSYIDKSPLWLFSRVFCRIVVHLCRMLMVVSGVGRLAKACCQLSQYILQSFPHVFHRLRLAVWRGLINPSLACSCILFSYFHEFFTSQPP